MDRAKRLSDPDMERNWAGVVDWCGENALVIFDLLTLRDYMYRWAGGERDHDEVSIRYQNLAGAAKRLEEAARDFREALGLLPPVREILSDDFPSPDPELLDAVRGLAGSWGAQIKSALSVIDGTSNEGRGVSSLKGLAEVGPRKPLHKMKLERPADRYLLKAIAEMGTTWVSRGEAGKRWPQTALVSLLSAVGVDTDVRELADVRRDVRDSARKSS